MRNKLTTGVPGPEKTFAKQKKGCFPSGITDGLSIMNQSQTAEMVMGNDIYTTHNGRHTVRTASFTDDYSCRLP